mgnify:FL=1
MLHIIKQTKEEQFNMYMQLPKEEIIEMLIESNRIIEELNAPFLRGYLLDEEIHKMD